MQDAGVARLREHLRQHNRRVVLLSVLTLVAAVLFWAGLYFITWWLFILSNAAVRPLDWQPSSRPLLTGFVIAALVLCALAWLIRRVRPNEMPRDHKGVFETLLDFLLAVPRMTLSIFGTATARVRLDEHQLVLAWNLLQRMRDAGRPLPIYEVPLDLPNEPLREKILLALQLSELIEVRRSKSGPVLAFCNDSARQLAEERVRLR